MKKNIIALLIFSSGLLLQAQVGVGINIQDPKATMHLIPTTTGATTAEGFIAPNLTRAQLISKDPVYTKLQKGAIVYVTDLTGTLTLKTAKVTAIGYYYYDGDSNAWQTFSSGAVIPTIPTEPLQIQGQSTKATANTQNIYQQGNFAIGTKNTDAPSIYKLDVAGTSNVSGNSRVGSSTVVGAETVGKTLNVTGATTLSPLTVAGISNLNGTTNTKATNISGQLNYKPGGVAPVANTYLRTDALGNATWQALPITAITEPWQVQGGTTLATTNVQDIYQQGSVAIGSNSANGYNFQVTGTSNISANSRVGVNSTVATSQTVQTLLDVTGASTLTGIVGIGGAPVAGTALKVTGNEHITATSKIGTNTATVNPSAQLELADNNKGFLVNRVALTSPSLQTPVTGVVDGIMVYNTSSLPGLGLEPGYYYWRSSSWHRLVDAIPEKTLYFQYLSAVVESEATTGRTTYLGNPLSFGEVIEIPQDGSYAFTLSLYGTVIPQPTALTSGVYYIALMNGDEPLPYALKDTAEMDVLVGSTNVMSYTITLGAHFNAGDKVVFRLCHYNGINYKWRLNAGIGVPTDVEVAANRTSLMWWKL